MRKREGRFLGLLVLAGAILLSCDTEGSGFGTIDPSGTWEWVPSSLGGGESRCTVPRPGGPVTIAVAGSSATVAFKLSDGTPGQATGSYARDTLSFTVVETTMEGGCTTTITTTVVATFDTETRGSGTATTQSESSRSCEDPACGGASCSCVWGFLLCPDDGLSEPPASC